VSYCHRRLAIGSFTLFGRHLSKCYQGGCGELYRAYSISPEIIVLANEDCGRLVT
jgi:hypothetical protein